jgi:hypothetical protein
MDVWLCMLEGGIVINEIPVLIASRVRMDALVWYYLENLTVPPCSNKYMEVFVFEGLTLPATSKRSLVLAACGKPRPTP